MRVSQEDFDTMDRLLEELVEQQRQKVLRVARRIRANLSEDDLRDPHSFPEVSRNPEWSFEDGVLAGLVSARVAVLRELRAEAEPARNSRNS